MLAISLPLAQSKASRRSVGFWVIGRAPWPPSYFCDHTCVRRPSGARMQGRPCARESFASTGMTSRLVIPISCATPQVCVKTYTSNHRFDFGNRAAAFSLDREGEVPLWL